MSPGYFAHSSTVGLGPVAFVVKWQFEEACDTGDSVQVAVAQSPEACPGRGVQDALTVPVGTVVSLTSTVQSVVVKFTWTVLGLHVKTVCVL